MKESNRTRVTVDIPGNPHRQYSLNPRDAVKVDGLTIDLSFVLPGHKVSTRKVPVELTVRGPVRLT